MTRRLLLFFSLTLLFYNVSAHNLNALFSLCTFNSPDKGPYVETYLNVVGNSVRLVKGDQGKFQGKVEVELTFTMLNEIKYHDKYNLLSPPLDDTTGFLPDFIDQQRISLSNGEYDLELKLTDKYITGQSITVHRTVKINYPKDSVSISDIELVSASNKATEETPYTKSGLSIVPLGDNYYAESLTMLKFYTEIYNTKTVLKEYPFIIDYFVFDQDNKYVVQNLAGHRREMPQDVCVILAQIPIKDLPSGNYNLTVDIRNKDNVLLSAKQVFFQRSNTIKHISDTADVRKVDIANTFASHITDKDTLEDYIKSLHPISTRLEEDYEESQVGVPDLKYMQKFFYDFWVKRSAANPEKAWRDYLTEVKKVNAAYSTNTAKGYVTDRGRVYLQYGPPTSIYKEDNEPDTYPYEIWHYYKLGKQSNRKFLFYCPDLSSNGYILLHSDATGEVNNPHWQTDLSTNPAATSGHASEKAAEEFKNPK